MESRSAPQSRIIDEETPYLAEEVILEEILPRLPVKSLLKFRCVSKLWCSFIGSNRFTKAHLKNSINSSSVTHQWIFFDIGKRFKQCSLPSVFDKTVTDPITCSADLGIDWGKNDFSHAECCNGLVYILLNYKNFVLWNPSTKKFRNLPDPYNQIELECGSIVNMGCGPIVNYGFGFDELNDDYKVFGTVIPHRNARVALTRDSTRCIGIVYSLRANSWKVIGERDVLKSEDESNGTYVSGKLHWCRHQVKQDIVSFDLNRHVYGVVELPSYMKGCLYSLGVLGGCLSAHFYHQNCDIDIWVMKEYGVKESWDKVATVPQCKLPAKGIIPTPLAIGPNGEVLLLCGSTAVIYNPKCGVFEHPSITVLDVVFAMIDSLGIYIESLVSVAPDSQ